MKLHIPFFFFFYYCFIASCGHSLAQVTDQNVDDLTVEASILLSIKASLIDPLNHLQDWQVADQETGNSTYHCSWTGVHCNSNGDVDKLDLLYMNLSGIISDDIETLQSLTSLNLSGNGFTSPWPKSLTNLTAMISIDLSLNNFLDGFPVGFGRLAGLLTLSASSNNFTGFTPRGYWNWSCIQPADNVVLILFL